VSSARMALCVTALRRSLQATGQRNPDGLLL